MIAGGAIQGRPNVQYIQHAAAPQYVQQPMPQYIQQPMPQYIQQPRPQYIQQPMPQYIQQQQQQVVMQQPVQIIQAQPRVDPEVIEGINSLLADHQQLKAQFQEVWDAARGGDEQLNLQEMKMLAKRVQETMGIPVQAFGNLAVTFEKFDFDGNRRLNFREAYRCLKHCMTEWRDSHGFAPVETVETKTPEQAGFTLIKVLAHGGQGEARLVQHPELGELVLKTYDRSNANAGGIEELQEEMHHMQQVDRCPSIATCHEIFQDAICLYMVSDAYSGGDWASLNEKAAEAGVALTEDYYRSIFQQAFEGLAYLHSHAIMHCDIKEPNLMIKGTDYENPEVVIIDLGLAKSYLVDQSGGTPGYMPPEVVDLFAGGQGAWYPKGDVFSMGVTCFQILTKRVPDEKTGRMGLFTEGCRTQNDWINFTKAKQPPFHEISSAPLRKLLQKCLSKTRQSRSTAPQVLEDRWFKSGTDAIQAPQAVSTYTITPQTGTLETVAPVACQQPVPCASSVQKRIPIYTSAAQPQSPAAQVRYIQPAKPQVLGAPQVNYVPAMHAAPQFTYVQQAAPSPYVIRPAGYS